MAPAEAVEWPRVAHARVASFTLRVARLQRPELQRQAVVVGAGPGQSFVAECSSLARARGIRVGMPLRLVPAICPEAVVISPDPTRYRAFEEQLWTAWERLSPHVEPDGPGRAFLDLRGLAGRYANPEALLREIVAAAPKGLEPWVGAGPGKLVAALASLAARENARAFGGSMRAVGGSAAGGGERSVDAGPRYRLVTSVETASFLSEQPIDRLPIDGDEVDRLRRLGVHAVGQLLGLSDQVLLQGRLGPLVRRLRQAIDRPEGDPIRPRKPEVRVLESVQLPAPLAETASLRVVVRRLVERALRRPEMQGRAIGQVLLSARSSDGQVWQQQLALKEASSDRGAVERMIAARFEAVQLGAAIEELHLEFCALSASGRQTSLPVPSGQRRPRDVSNERERRLIQAIGQLSTRFGRPPVCRIVELEPESRLPERRFGLLGLEA